MADTAHDKAQALVLAVAGIVEQTAAAQAAIADLLSSTTATVDQLQAASAPLVETARTAAVDLEQELDPGNLPSLGVRTAASVVDEGSDGVDRAIRFTIEKTGDAAVPCSAVWHITGDVDAGDLAPTQKLTGPVDLPAGITALPIDVLVRADKVAELDEVLRVELSAPVGCTISVDRPKAEVIIRNDDVVGGELGEVLRTFHARNRDEAVAMINAGKGGDLIRIQNGVNVGGLVVNSPGDNAGRPLMIACQDDRPSVASFVMGGDLVINAPHVLFWGGRVMGQKVLLQGDYSRLRRVLFKGARIKSQGHPGQVIVNGRGNVIEYFEMDDSDSRGIRLETKARATRILHGYIHDFVQADPEQVFEPIQLYEGGNTYRLYPDPKDGPEVGWCYFHNCNKRNKENEDLSVKGPFANLHHLHFDLGRCLNFRFSYHGRAFAVRITNGGWLMFAGADNVLNSVWIDDAHGFQIQRGNWDSASPGIPPPGAGGPSQHPNALRPKLVRCKGNISIGTEAGSIRVVDARIEGHLGGNIIDVQGGVKAWTQVAEASEPGEVPPLYDATSQGILAGL
jgi:hypothetical protein